MVHKRIEIPKQNFYPIMVKIGSIGNSIEFEDLNKNEIESSKPYSAIINRCDEIETIFTRIDDILLNQFNIQYDLYDNYSDFKSHLDLELNKKEQKISENIYLDHIQNIIVEDEIKIKTQYNLNKQLLDSFHILLEKKYVFEKMVELFNVQIIKDLDKKHELGNDYYKIINDDEEEQMLNINNKNKRKSYLEFSDFPLNYLCGICNNEDIMKLRRLIFRAGRGRAIPSFYNANISDEIILDEKKYFYDKQIFLIIIQGEMALKKIKNNLEIFSIEAYEINNINNIQKQLEDINNEILQQKEVVSNSEKALLEIITPKTNPTRGVGKNYKCLYSLYRTFCKREKYIYMNLNKCTEENSFFIGDVWIPEIALENLNSKIQELTNENEDILLPKLKNSINYKAKLRTFFQMDDFVYPFQAIVDTYGIPRYKEVNPGLFTIITFPFLFGIMFGDIGHGLLLLILSIYVEINYNKIINSNSILKNMVKYRYIFILMGFFSLYCGIIYNDFMSIPLSLFSSCYKNVKTSSNLKLAKKIDKCIYPIGIDPKWYSATNDLVFMNSFKMKWSVIVGVIQMTLGIFLRGLNNIYFSDYLGFFFEFIPQIIFMLLLFGYMILLIFIKWGTDYSKNTAKAPSIITILMNLALKKGSVDEKPVWSSVKFEEQTNRRLFLISLICVPIILLPKPIIKIIRNHLKNKKVEFNYLKNNINEKEINIEMPIISNNIENIDNDNKDETEPLLENDLLKAELKFDEQVRKSSESNILNNMEPEKEESASDILVNQIIETIEFVLGCVSNTASYLRLWALSLAHSQLSKVFFEKSLFGLAIGNNFIFVIVGYFLFANITISVLMGMDLLEAFLHTLRLHWVEFQNKFYYADGTPFIPYSFHSLLEKDK